MNQQRPTNSYRFVEHVVKPVLLQYKNTCIVLYFYCKKALINTIDREPFFTGSPQITLTPHVDLFMGGFSCHTETANALLENVVAQLEAPIIIISHQRR